MTAPTLATVDQLETLVGRWGTQQAVLFENTTSYALSKWLPVDPFAGDQVWQFGKDMEVASKAMQVSSRALTFSYLRMALIVLGSPLGQKVIIPAAANAVRAGIELARAYERPAQTVRYELSIGTDPAVAAAKGRNRLRALVTTDAALAARDAAHDTLNEAQTVTGFRRVLHPELARGGSCGLCVAAADRPYAKADLMPLHDGCGCAVLPILGENDPGHTLNSADLKKLYADAGGTTAGPALHHVKVAVRQHGELGPVLVDARHHFRGPRAAKRVA